MVNFKSGPATARRWPQLLGLISLLYERLPRLPKSKTVSSATFGIRSQKTLIDKQQTAALHRWWLEDYLRRANNITEMFLSLPEMAIPKKKILKKTTHKI